jgi:hypothetical protein
MWGMDFPNPYMTLYNASATAVKSVGSKLRIGGPATARLGHVADFMAAAKDPKDSAVTLPPLTSSLPLISFRR